MMRDQVLPAFICKLLLHHDVEPSTIEEAVNEVLDVGLGESFSEDNQLVRAFAMEQASRVMKGAS